MSIALPYQLAERGPKGLPCGTFTFSDWAALLFLAARANAKGETDVNTATLASYLGLSMRSAQASVLNFISHEFVLPRSRPRENLRLNIPHIANILERK